MDNKYLKSFINYLIDVRAIDSVKDFAEKSDINRQYIYRMLEGKVKISSKTIAKIRAVFADQLIDYHTRNKHLITPELNGRLISEDHAGYGPCKDCAGKDAIIEQQKATIAALQEALDLYRKISRREQNENLPEEDA